MKRIVARFLPACAAAALLAQACGPAPVPLERSEERSASASPEGLPPGHPPLDGGAMGGPAHPDMGSAAAAGARFAGVVRLAGPFAESEEGYLFVSVLPEGLRMPCFSRKYALADAEEGADGERRLRFELDADDTMAGLPPGDGPLVLEARFDPDGSVDTKEGVVKASVPIQPGDTSAEVVLGS